MKIRALILTLLLSISLVGTTYADYTDGYNAFQRGDYQTAFREWRPLANQGDAAAQSNLGLMYEYGSGVLKDYKEAVKWYRKAAEQGYAKAQGNLGVLYANGDGILKDLSKAKYWIKKSYENPDAENSTVELAEENWNKLELWKY